jgi:hypothetical protein
MHVFLKQLVNLERWQSNAVLAWEGTAAAFAVKYMEQIGHSRARLLQASLFTDSLGDKRECDAAACNSDTALLVECKSMARLMDVDQLLSLKDFVR